MICCSKNRFWTTYVFCCRALAVIVSLGLWGLGAESVTYFNVADGVLILLAAFIVTLLESVFVLDILLPACPQLQHSPTFGRIWRALNWVDVWRKGLLYCVLSAPCYPAAQSYMTIWAYCSGTGLCILGIMYGILTLNKSPAKVVATRESQNNTYDRFEDVADIDELEDSIVNPMSNVGVITMSEQSEILDV